MKKKILLIIPFLFGITSCDNNTSSPSSIISTNQISCTIKTSLGGSIKAYKDGKLLGEASPSSYLELSSLELNDKFTIEVILDEGYTLLNAYLNDKLLTSDSNYFTITLTKLDSQILFNFKLIETKDADFTYSYNNETKKATIISYSSEQIPTPLLVPSTTTYLGETYKVSYIQKDAFANSEITKVNIPSSIENIELGAFNNAYNISYYIVDSQNPYYSSLDGVLYNKDKTKLVSFPVKYASSNYDVLDSVTSFEDYSFYQNRSIKTIKFNSKIETIGESAFYNSTFLEEVNFPSSLKCIKENAFYQNSSLKTITFIDGIKEISDSAFYGCIKIHSLEFPSSLTKIGTNSFFKCDRLSSITFNEGLEEIGELAFSNETNVTSISLPASLKKIGNSAFSVCDKLETVTFKEGLEEIGNSAFALCSSLKGLDLPASLKKIGYNPFYADLKLDASNFKISSSNEYFTIKDGVLYSKDMTRLICYPYGKEDEEFTIPEGVTILDVYSFRLLANLKTINMPISVTKLDECFYSMSTSLTINYSGTKEQYNLIDKAGSNGEEYNLYTSTTIICSDGTIK